MGNSSATSCGGGRLCWTSLRSSRLPLLALVTLCLFVRISGHYAASVADLLGALERTQRSSSGGAPVDHPAIVQTVLEPGASDEGPPLRAPLLLQQSGKVVGVLDSRVAQGDHSTGHLDWVVVDVHGATPGLLLLSAGAEVTLERLTLTLARPGMSDSPRSSGELGHVNAGPDGSAAAEAVVAAAKALVARLLLHAGSRGILALDGVVMDLGSCPADERDAAPVALTAVTAAAATSGPGRYFRGLTTTGRLQQQHQSGVTASAVSDPGSSRLVHVVQSSRTVVGEGVVLVLRNTQVRCTVTTGAAAATRAAAASTAAVTTAAEAMTAAGAVAERNQALIAGGAGPLLVRPGGRQLLAAVASQQPRPQRTRKLGHGLPLAAQVVVIAVAVMAAVGGVWLRRLLSCACLAPPTPPSAAELNNRAQNGSRSFHKTSTPMARNSQNHALSGLSRFSAQLRKGDDPSVRDGSVRGGSMLFRADGSVRGGSRHQPGTAAVPEAPALLKELSELKPAGQGRLATSLQGIWQQQQRVVVKVLSHGEDCCFMLEQVGEVWTRLTHANIVTCCAAETFPASALASVPEMAQLVPKPTNPEANNLQTWIVLERCENGSLAAVLAQRHQQQRQAARKAGGGAAAIAGGGGDAHKETTARQMARRLGRFSRGRNKGPGGVKDGAAAAAAAAQDQASPSPSPPELSAAELPSPLPEEQPAEGEAPSPSPPALVSLGKEIREAVAAAAADSAPNSNVSGGNGGNGGEDSRSGSGGGGGGAGGEAAPPSPGLLPLAEVLSIAHDVASGLAYLHSLDLCHGDLRAENVMVQTVVLPSAVRAAETPALADAATAAADGLAAPVDPTAAVFPCSDGDGRGAGAGGVLTEAEMNAAAAAMALGSCHTVDEGLAVMYGSNSGRSDAAEGVAVVGGASGAVPAVGAGGGGGGGGVTYQRPTLTNMSSYGNTTASCTGVQDNSGHVWSASLRQSNGFMTGSTYASTAAQSLAAAAGGGGGIRIGVSGAGVGGRCMEHGSVDDRLVPGSLHSQGLPSTIGHGYLSPGGRPMGQAYAVNGFAAKSMAAAGGASGSGHGAIRYGSALTAGTGAGALGESSAAAGGGDGAGTALTAAAVAALSRAIGVSSSGALQPPPRAATGAVPTSGAAAAAATQLSSGGGGGGGAPFVRRQSNGSLSAANTNSGNDASLMSKALSGLTAWPESPHEGGHVVLPSAVTVAAGARAGAGGSGGSSSVLNGAASNVASGAANGFRRSGSGAAGALPPAPPPARKVPVMGGLKSALTAPDASRTVATLASPPPPSRLAAKAPAQTASPFASQEAQVPPLSDAAVAAELAASRFPVDSDPSIRGGAAGASSAAALASPRVIAVQIDVAGGSTGPPSPSGGAQDAASTAPSTPTGAGAGGRSRTGVGVVCTIAGHQGRRCSAPSVVALPVIRRVAKLTDPWLSLARVPAEAAGGPWSPEAAEAVGATCGADVSHLPPELLLSGRLHPSSDVYSLGMLMWRMLSVTGEAPYGKLRPAEVAYKVVACGMRPAFSPAIPEPLRRLVEDCWQSDPAARPTVQQVLQRLSELQSSAAAMAAQWRERHALFGAVATVPISAVAVLPMRGEQNDVTSRWAEAAGIKLLHASTSWGGSGGGAAPAAAAVLAARGSVGDLSAHTSFAARSSRGHSGHFSGVGLLTSGGGAGGGGGGGGTGHSGSAAHLYQQPPPPTPPAGVITNTFSMRFPTATSTTVTGVESRNQSNAAVAGAAADGYQRKSQSEHRPANSHTGHLPVQPYRRGPVTAGGGGAAAAALEPF